jgi:hypothetical protein
MNAEKMPISLTNVVIYPSHLYTRKNFTIVTASTATIEIHMSSASRLRSKPSFRRLRQHAPTYLAWLPLAFLTACAVQQPALPPAAQTPVASSAPETVAAAPDSSPVVAPVESATTAAPAEKVAALRAWVGQQHRLYTIAAPLLINNTELCKRNARYLLGLTAKTKYSYSNDYVSAAQSAFGLGEQLRIMNVLPGSGAAQHGIRQGDILLAVENKPLPRGANAEREAGAVVAAAMKGRTGLNLTLQRGGERFTTHVPLTRACAFGIELGNADRVNSYADGHRVMITRGMLNFTQSDEELAYALAKEIAHNMLAQSPRPRTGALIDSLRLVKTDAKGMLIAQKIKPYSPVMDATADKLSLYMLARAGYSIDNALPFWKRLASRYPENIQNGHTALHPATAYRLSVMTEIVQVIKQKQAHKQELVP